MRGIIIVALIYTLGWLVAATVQLTAPQIAKLVVARQVAKQNEALEKVLRDE